MTDTAANPTSFRFRLQTFGGWRLTALDGTERVWQRIHTRKTASLVALLAVWPRAWRREELCLQLWPDALPESSRNSLSASLSALRRELGDEAFIADRHTVALNNTLWSCDWAEFEIALKLAESGFSSEGTAALRVALEIAAGTFLPELDEEPLLERSRYVEESLRAATQKHLDNLVKAAYEDEKLASALLDLATRGLKRFPNEWNWMLYLMRAQERLGDYDAALRWYEKLQSSARKAGDLTPEPARLLAKELRKQSQTTTSLLPRTNSVLETASDVTPAEATIIEKAPSVFTTKTLQGPILPPRWTSFFGRQDEIQGLTELLRGGEKLITLSGPGGTGKTRLALQVARQMVDGLSGRVFFVPLAGLFDPNLLLTTVRDGLSIPTGSDLPPKEQIALALGQQSALVVLDNFEQLGIEGAIQFQELRDLTPNVQFLVTSRALLGLIGEREWDVPPLQSEEAKELFLDRATGRWSGPEHSQAIADLCWRLEDLPLAVELAAARSALLSPAQILERLDHKFDFLSQRGPGVANRHRTLRATIEWSFELLDDDVRRFFLQMSVFRDGWSLEAACAVAQVEEWKALDFLSQLREHSLLSASEELSRPRFRMLVMLREWAQEQLTETQATELSQRHFDYFLQLIEENRTPHAIAENSEVLSQEMANFRAAIRQALARPDSEATLAAARICTALFPLWESASQYQVAREWFERTVLKSKEPGQNALEPKCHGRLLASGGLALWYCGEYNAAYDTLKEGLVQARRGEDATTEASILAALSRTTMTLGRVEESLETATQSLAIARRLNDPIRLADALLCQGWAYNNTEQHVEGLVTGVECFQVAQSTGIVPLMTVARALEAYCLTCTGNQQEALALVESGIQMAEETKNEWSRSMSNAMFGVVAREAGDVHLARYLSTTAARSFARIGTRWEVASSLTDCAALACDEAQWERAARLFGAAQKMADGICYKLIPSLARFIPGRSEKLRMVLSPDDYYNEWHAGAEMTLEEALQEVDALAVPHPDKVWMI